MVMTAKEYEEALKKIYALMDSLPGSSEEKELDILSQKVVEYERIHFPMD